MPTLEASLRRLMAAIAPGIRLSPGHGPSSTMVQEARAATPSCKTAGPASASAPTAEASGGPSCRQPAAHHALVVAHLHRAAVGLDARELQQLLRGLHGPTVQ